MLHTVDHLDALDHATDALRHAPKPSEALIGDVALACCRRLPALAGTRQAAQIAELVKAGAWLDASLALVACELPQWTLRRLLYEDGQWHCALSRQPELPFDLDDTADGDHEALPLAILLAFVEARRRARRRSPGRSPSIRTGRHRPPAS